MFTGAIVLIALSVVQINEEEWRQFAQRVREMFRIHDVPVTKAAREFMGMDPADFQRCLDGERKFDYRRIYMLPAEMRATLSFLELEAYGLPGWVQRAVRVAAPFNQKEVA